MSYLFFEKLELQTVHTLRLNNALCFVLPSYAVICYVVLCYMSCCVVLCYVMLNVSSKPVRTVSYYDHHKI